MLWICFVKTFEHCSVRAECVFLAAVIHKAQLVAASLESDFDWV